MLHVKLVIRISLTSSTSGKLWNMKGGEWIEASLDLILEEYELNSGKHSSKYYNILEEDLG